MQIKTMKQHYINVLGITLMRTIIRIAYKFNRSYAFEYF